MTICIRPVSSSAAAARPAGNSPICWRNARRHRTTPVFSWARRRRKPSSFSPTHTLPCGWVTSTSWTVFARMVFRQAKSLTGCVWSSTNAGSNPVGGYGGYCFVPFRHQADGEFRQHSAEGISAVVATNTARWDFLADHFESGAKTGRGLSPQYENRVG